MDKYEYMSIVEEKKSLDHPKKRHKKVILYLNHFSLLALSSSIWLVILWMTHNKNLVNPVQRITTVIGPNF